MPIGSRHITTTTIRTEDWARVKHGALVKLTDNVSENEAIQRPLKGRTFQDALCILNLFIPFLLEVRYSKARRTHLRHLNWPLQFERWMIGTFVVISRDASFELKFYQDWTCMYFGKGKESS